MKGSIPGARGNIPKYAQVKRELIRLVADGVFPVGSRIYSADELIARYGVARGTVRKAIEELIVEGYLHAEQGRGTFVRSVTGHEGEAVSPQRNIEMCFSGQRTHVHNPHNFNILHGALAVATERGYRLRVAVIPTEPLVDPLLFMEERQCHGSQGLLFAYSFPEPLAAPLSRHGLPFVLMNCGVRRPGLYSVEAIGASAVGRALQHLVHLGRRHIALIAFEPRDMPSYGVYKTSTEQCVNTYLREMRALGRDVEDGGVVRAEPEIAAGRAAALRLFAQDPRPDAILAEADLLAIGVYEAAAELGLRIPQDLAVIGTGQLEIGLYLHPALTTIRMPGYEVGARGTGVLIDLIEDRKPRSNHIQLRGDLVIRESCGFETRKDFHDAPLVPITTSKLTRSARDRSSQ